MATNNQGKQSPEEFFRNRQQLFFGDSNLTEKLCHTNLGFPRTMSNEAGVEEALARDLKSLGIGPSSDGIDTNASENDNVEAPRNSTKILVLDAGYGFPREKKVRKEKINAIASQLSNFLVWQIGPNGSAATNGYEYASVRVVGCPDQAVKNSLENRTIENMKRASSTPNFDGKNLPSHVTLSCETLEECLEHLVATNPPADKPIDEPVYLSPDAAESLDICGEPPEIAIVGLLIDRRVQPNRSRDRANTIGIVAKRWPLEDCFAEIDSHEPLNVDCVLEGMQQWWWNWKDTSSSCSDTVKRETFIQAASQAIEHHVKRHPSRPLHIDKSH